MVLMEKVTHRSPNAVFISKCMSFSLKKYSWYWIKASIQRSSMLC